jgi:hypothetical protein
LRFLVLYLAKTDLRTTQNVHASRSDEHTRLERFGTFLDYVLRLAYRNILSSFFI